MTAILALLWLIGIVTSLVFIVRPSTRWAVFSTRKRAAITGVCIFLGFPILQAIIAPKGNPTAADQPTKAPSTTSKLATSEPTSVHEKAANTSAPTAGETAPPTAAANWVYRESSDEMRGTKSNVASVESNESFPNSFGIGGETTSLVVLKRPKGTEIELNNSNLQFTCNSFTSTHISAKFDNGPIERFGCTDAKGSKFGVAFILGETKFLSQLRKAKKLVVEAEIFQRGDTQMTFDVAGLTL